MTKDEATVLDLQKGTLVCSEGDELAESIVSVFIPSKNPAGEGELQSQNGGDVGIRDAPYNSVSSESEVQPRQSEDIFQCSMGEEEEEPGAEVFGYGSNDKVEREIIEIETTGEDEEVDNGANRGDEPKNMVKLVFKDKQGGSGEVEVTSGQPQKDAFRWGSLNDSWVCEHLICKNCFGTRLAVQLYDFMLVC